MRSLRHLLFSAAILVSPNLGADQTSVVVEMAETANRWLAALTPEQRAKAVLDLKSEERFNFHFIPRPRAGLSFKEMTPAERSLARALLKCALSERGHLKATTIMGLDEILREIEKGSGPVRDPELYFISIFGRPDVQGVWGWRLEGHHLSLNFLVAGKNGVAITPSFLGANPGEVRNGPRKGLRVLGGEEDLGRQLVKSFDAPQRRFAIYTNTAPQDIITGTNRIVQTLVPMGISADQLSPTQAELLRRLIEEYVRNYRAELAEADLQRIDRAGASRLFFAWAGGLEPGEGHYYRIQSPTFVMEYDNTQNHANHIHTVWRDLENDFGGDMLRRHYEHTTHSK